MSALTDFYKFYAPLRSKYSLRLTWKTSQKETRIVIYQQNGKELVKIAEEDEDTCFIRAKRELEHKLKNRSESL